jgi:hypothetical protein
MTLPPQRKRGSQRHVSGCKTLRSRLHCLLRLAHRTHSPPNGSASEIRSTPRLFLRGPDFVNVSADVNSMVDEIDPRQPFLRVNIFRWRKIFRMIETPSSNVDLIGAFVVLIGQRRSAPTAKRPARSRLRPILAGRSFHELELRTFYCDPGYCLSSGGAPTVSAMTIRPDKEFGRRAETHLAAITTTGDFLLFHSSHRKLGMSDRNRDNLLVGEAPIMCRNHR